MAVFDQILLEPFCHAQTSSPTTFVVPFVRCAKVMEYLGYVSGSTNQKTEQIQRRVQQAQPILESFGNAVTMRTDCCVLVGDSKLYSHQSRTQVGGRNIELL